MKKNVFVFLGLVLLFVACKSSQDTETWVVASERGDCVGVMPMKCLLIKKEGQTDWEYIYQEIEGFNPESGYEYKIKIQKEEVENPAADRSSLRYILKKEISKVQKTSENLPGR